MSGRMLRNTHSQPRNRSRSTAPSRLTSLDTVRASTPSSVNFSHSEVSRLLARREAHSALRTQRGTAIETHPTQLSHQYRERPHQPFPQLHAAVLRSRLQSPRSLRSMARRTRQCRPQQPKRAQAAARVTLTRQHALLTTPPGE